MGKNDKRNLMRSSAISLSSNSPLQLNFLSTDIVQKHLVPITGIIGGNQQVRYGTARRTKRACECSLSDEEPTQGYFGSRRQCITPVLCQLALKHSLRDDAPVVAPLRPQRIRISKRGGVNGQVRQDNHCRAHGCGACVCGGSLERQGQRENRLHWSADWRRLGQRHRGTQFG